MHTKKRNRLQHKRLNDVVFVSYNRKMRTRFQMRREKAGKSYDPLVIEDFDWNNEWTDSSVVPLQGARGCVHDLTWEDVDEAVGASRSLRGRHFPRQANMAYQRRASNTRMALEDEETFDPHNEAIEEAIEEEEDEEEDPHDDADVSDCDEAPSAIGDGENNNCTINLDMFDDGY